MFKKRRTCLVAGLLVAAIGGAGYCFHALNSKATYIGQPVETDVVVRRDSEDETIHIPGQAASCLLESLFPKLYDKPARATAATSNAMFRFRFHFPNGMIREVQVSAKDESGERYYGGGQFAVCGDLDRSLSMAPFLVAKSGSMRTLDERELKRTQEWLTTHEDDYLDVLLEWLDSENEMHQRHAARWLDRPVDHPRIAEIRRAALRVMRSILHQHHVARSAPKSTQVDRFRGYGTFITLCNLMNRIGDLDIAGELTKMLAITDAERHSEDLLRTATELYGLPPLFESVSGCGNVSTQVAEQRRTENLERLRKGRAELLTWTQEFAEASKEVRLQSVVDRWEAHIQNDKQRHRYLGNDLSIFSPLLRFGAEVLPHVAAKRDSSTDLHTKGQFALVAAGLGSDIDDGLIGNLLMHRDEEGILACELIRVGGKTQFSRQLVELQSIQPGSDFADKSRKTLDYLSKKHAAQNP